MSTEGAEQSPWSRPGFIAAAVIVVALVVTAILLAINGAGDDRVAADPGPTISSTPPTEPNPDETVKPDDSVCGLQAPAGEGATTLAGGPEATWAYQDTTAYPTSDIYGPGVTDAQGLRYCFQRSVEGALFAAANSLTQSIDPLTAASWREYILVESPQRDEILAAPLPEPAGNTRITLSGFRVMEYTGETARIDLAFRASSDGQTFYVSAVYPFRWEEGDWRLDVSSAEELERVAQIPDLAGYIRWGA